MTQVEAGLEELGLALPAPMRLPPGIELPFAWVRVRGERAFVSSHGPLDPDGSLPLNHAVFVAAEVEIAAWSGQLSVSLPLGTDR